jgi:hypothetical protein
MIYSFLSGQALKERRTLPRFSTKLIKPHGSGSKLKLNKGNFPREDYRELVELNLIWLGGTLPNSRKLFLRKPGACFTLDSWQNRFIFLKMELLSERIDMTINERRNVHRMAQFIGLFYAKQFLRSRIAIFSPTDDFQFYGSMLSYKEEDSDIAMAVLNSIEWFAVAIFG